MRIPEGAIRYNTDSNKMEVWIGDTWMEVSVTFEALGISGRGIFAGGYQNPGFNTIDFIQISTLGNAIEFGDTTFSAMQTAGFGNRIRGIYAGSYIPASMNNTIEFVNFATTGNGQDFGDAVITKGKRAGCNSPTRGIIAGGGSDAGYPAHTKDDEIDFVTMSSTGNAQDFGNLTVARDRIQGFSSPTRGVFCGGESGPSGSPSTEDTVDYITIASVGNATDFGNLTDARNMTSTASNNTRGLCMGGANHPAMAKNVIDFVTIATTGNFTDFGDLFQGGRVGGAVSSPTRIVQGEGIDASANSNLLQFVTIATTGNATDFGDLTLARNGQASMSNTNGGL